MAKSNRVRIAVEGFEDRLTPAVSAVLDGGTLRVSGAATEPTALIRVNQAAAGKFQVFDGAAKVGEYAVSKDVAVALTKAADKLEVNLGGFAFAGGLAVSLGDGDNAFRLVGRATATASNALGSAKAVSVVGGAGKDDLTVAHFATPGGMSLNGGPGTDGAMTDGTVSVGELSVGGAERVAVGAGTGVARGTTVNGGPGGGSVLLAGKFAGPTTVLWQAVGTATNAAAGVGVSATGQFADLTVNVSTPATSPTPGTAAGASVSLTGKVAGTFTARTGAGNDFVTVAKGATVAKLATISTGEGSDTVAVAGAVGTPGISPPPAGGRSLVVETGGGEDRVELAAGAKLVGEAFVHLGAGADRLTVAPNAVFTKLRAEGGDGKDTFAGSKSAAGLTLLGFEVFV